MEDELDNSLLARYFEGNVTKDELLQIENWAKDEKNRKKLNQYITIWQMQYVQSSTHFTNVHVAWDKIVKRLINRISK